MFRLPDWEERIVRYLEPLHAVTFDWGAHAPNTHDCCSFTGGCVEAMTGEDPLPEFRDARGKLRYSTAIGSARALRRFGAGDLASTIDTKLSRVSVSLAHRGDIVMNAGGLGLLWTSMGQGVALMVGSEGSREGLISLSRSQWIDPIAWRVPYGA